MTDTSLRYGSCFNLGIRFVLVLQGSNSPVRYSAKFGSVRQLSWVFKVTKI